MEAAVSVQGNFRISPRRDEPSDHLSKSFRMQVEALTGYAIEFHSGELASIKDGTEADPISPLFTYRAETRRFTSSISEFTPVMGFTSPGEFLAQAGAVRSSNVIAQNVAKYFDFLRPSSRTVVATAEDVGVLSYSDKRAIDGFLGLRPEVKNILRPVAGIVREYFPNAKLELELFTDPEEEGNVPQVLFLNIRTSISAGEALKRLSDVDQVLMEKFQISSKDFNLNLSFE